MLVSKNLKESVLGSTFSRASHIYDCLSENLDENEAAGESGEYIGLRRLGREGKSSMARRDFFYRESGEYARAG